MRIEKVQAWRTSDGTYHSGPKMAEQFVLNAELIGVIGDLSGRDAQDVLNALSGNRKLMRQWLDACDAMEREGLEP